MKINKPRSRGMRLGVVVAVCAPLVLAACSSDADSNGGDAGKPFVAERATNVAGDLLPEDRVLWTYDAATGKYVEVKGDASTYTPTLEKPTDPTTIAYMDPWGSNPFAIPIREGVQQLTKKLGIKLIYCDTEFKPERAVSCAETLASQSPDFAIAGNWQTGASAATVKVFDEAKIPTNSIDVVQPNSIFFGADNYTSGAIAGRAAGEYAKQTWDCKDVWILLGENKEEGEAADQRLAGFADGVQEICGTVPSDRIARQRMSAGTADQAITATTDWMTAHPQATNLLGTSLDDERSSGIAKAMVQNNSNGVVASTGCDTVGIEVLKQAPASENHYLGCAAFFPEKYADYLVALALDVLAGKPVPNEVHLEHRLLTHDTIGEVYPE
ncbi:substrate-binding domain-containing protein [Micromonosporaceae bacterium B7E4]